MRLVLDTNVLIAAFVARGTCADLLEHCSRSHELITLEPLLAELLRVLTKKFGQRPIDARAAVSLLRTKCTIVDPAILKAGVCRDPDDVVVLATAMAGRCSAIVSGDHDLLTLDPFQKVRVLAPGDFWKFEAELIS